MSSSPVRIEVGGDGVAELILARPQSRNALNRAMTDEMARHLKAFDEDPAVRVVLLRADGDHFAAGADLKELAGLTFEQAVQMDFTGSCDAMEGFRKPIVTAVQGYALGGACEIVEMSDIVIADENAVFGHPEVRVGTMPGAGGTQRLPRIVGMTRALDLLLTGRQIDAHEALDWGLVSRVVAAGTLLSEARRLAGEMAALPTRVQAVIKAAARATARTTLDEGLRLERDAFHASLAAPEWLEGSSAFLGRRPPNFRACADAVQEN